MSPQVDVAELLRYITGESPADEALHVQTWCRLSGANAALLEGLRHGGDEGAAQLAVDVPRGMERLRNRLDGAPAHRTSVPHRPFKVREVVRPHSLWGRGWYAAASLVIGVLGIVVGRQGRTDHLFGPRAMSTYVTANGERANITLPDGSTVALNVASRLEVPGDYVAGNHTVHLMGEALFTVTRHEGMPFTVVADGVTARVLGTSFVVRHYGKDTTTTVVVRDGKVAVGSVVVSAARLLEVGPHGVARLGSADASRFGFATGVLQIPSMPLGQAVTELDRWYAADIRLSDASLARIPIKGKFAAGSASDLAEILEFMLDARVIRNDRVLTLYPKVNH